MVTWLLLWGWAQGVGVATAASKMARSVENSYHAFFLAMENSAVFTFVEKAVCMRLVIFI
jgi:hypothetical protein